MNGTSTNTLIPEQVQQFLDAHPEIEIFEAILPDINGRLRGKWIEPSKLLKAFKGGLKLPLSTLAFDVWGRDPLEWVYETGDADGICIPDQSTLTIVPWAKRSTAQVLLSLNESSGEACAYDPRNILRNLTERFTQLGLTPVLASEMEFYLLRSTDDADGVPRHTQTQLGGSMAIGGQTYGIDLMQDMAEIMHSIRDACAAQNLPIDTLIAEAAPSQYEINLHHQAGALLAADQGLMLQRAIKGVAAQYDLRATFMAKPFSELAGNGMHMHCSLINSAGDNAFNNGTDQGSDLLRHAIAGCLATMKESMLLFAPHFNSYKRLLPGSHAPTTPSWGYENRTTSIRVPADAHHAMRLEHRVAGADASVHLVAAAILAGMLYGIENKLLPPSPVLGDAYAQRNDRLPTNWPAALECFSKSSFIAQYFGTQFQRVYASTKSQEINEFQQHISSLEYQSYL